MDHLFEICENNLVEQTVARDAKCPVMFKTVPHNEEKNDFQMPHQISTLARA
jgi:hypothetical protein